MSIPQILNRAPHIDPVSHYIRGVYDEYMSRWHSGSEPSQSPPEQYAVPTTPNSTRKVAQVGDGGDQPRPTSQSSGPTIRSLLNYDDANGVSIPVQTRSNEDEADKDEATAEASAELAVETMRGKSPANHQTSTADTDKMAVDKPQHDDAMEGKRNASIEAGSQTSSRELSDNESEVIEVEEASDVAIDEEDDDDEEGEEYEDADESAAAKPALLRRKLRCFDCWQGGHFCGHSEAKILTLDEFLTEEKKASQKKATSSGQPQRRRSNLRGSGIALSRGQVRRDSHASDASMSDASVETQDARKRKPTQKTRVEVLHEQIDRALEEEIARIKRKHERELAEQTIIATQAAEQRKRDVLVTKCYYCWYYSQPCNPLAHPKCVPCSKNRRSCFGEYTRPEFCEEFLARTGKTHKLALLDDQSKSLSRRSWPLQRKGHQAHAPKPKGKKSKRTQTPQPQRFFLDDTKLKCYRCWDRNLSCDNDTPKCASCVKGRSTCFGFHSTRKEFCDIFEKETGTKHKWAASFDGSGPRATTHYAPPRTEQNASRIASIIASKSGGTPSTRKRPRYVLSDTEEEISEDEGWDSEENVTDEE